MNYNLKAMGRGRPKLNQFRKKNQKVVNIQRPLNKIPIRKSIAHSSSTSSALRWGASSSTNNNSSAILNSSTRSFTTDESDSKIILALSHGRGEATCEVGIALINVTKPSLILCQISDTPSYVNTLRKINIFSPNEILVPMTFMNNNLATNRLLDKIKQSFKDTTITAVGRPTFNNITGMQYVKQLCANEWNSVILILQQKYYCLSATAALLNYIETVHFVFYTSQSLKIEYQESEGFAIIDIATADSLELVSSISPVYNKKASLFGILNYCQTKIGSRTLRANILQPPCMVMDIESRLNCISELLKDQNILASIQIALNNLKNVDQLLTIPTISSENQESCSERQLNYILTLNSVLENINPLKEIIETFSEKFFLDFCKTLSNSSFIVIRKLIRLLIHTDARPGKGNQGTMQRCFAVKPGLNVLLDIVRKSYSERLDDMREYVKELAEKYNLPLTLGNNCKKGYHIVLSLNQHTKKSFKKSDLNPEFIQVERLATTVTMKTLHLLNLTVRVDDIQMEVMKLSNVMIYQLFIELRAYIGLFYQLCEEVAKLDMLQSLAQASCILSYTRPEFKDYMELVEARHPLLDILCSTGPVANSISVSKYKNIHIITGPNNSGKSIFIRQLLLLQVMAQVGCFVPATKAIFKPCDRILARVQFDDKMECNASSFVLEVKEMQYFRTVLTDNTLIIVDELCRSTSVGEGTALAVALCEDLAKTQAHCFFATHYIFMTNIADVYPNVQNWQMETLEEQQNGNIKLKYTYRLIPGVTTTKRYGLFAASLAWPKIIVARAKILFGNIQNAIISSGTKKMEEGFRLKYDLEAELKLLKLKGTLTCTELNAILTEYLERLKQLGYDLDDDNNVQLTVNSGNNSPGNVLGTTQHIVQIQNNPENNLVNSSNSQLINDYCEVVYSQTNTSSVIESSQITEHKKSSNSFSFLVEKKKTFFDFLNQDDENQDDENQDDKNQDYKNQDDKNQDEDPDITAGIQEAQEMSIYFTDNSEQDLFEHLPQEKKSSLSEYGTPINSNRFYSFLDDSKSKSFQFHNDSMKIDDDPIKSDEKVSRQEDADVTMALQEVQEFSQCFTDPNDEWNHNSFQIPVESIKNDENLSSEDDPDVAMALEEVNEVSQCFMDPNDEWNVANESRLSPKKVGKKHILIKSIHVFDALNNLVDVQIHPPPRNLNQRSREICENIIQGREINCQNGNYVQDVGFQEINHQELCRQSLHHRVLQPQDLHHQQHQDVHHQICQDIKYQDLHHQELHRHDLYYQALDCQDVQLQKIHRQDLHHQEHQDLHHQTRLDIDYQDLHNQELHCQDLHHQSRQDMDYQDLHNQELHRQDLHHQELHRHGLHCQELDCQDLQHQEIHRQNQHHQEHQDLHHQTRLDIDYQDLHHQELHCQDLHHQELHSQDFHHQEYQDLHHQARQDMDYQDLHHQELHRQDFHHQELHFQELQDIHHQARQDIDNQNLQLPELHHQVTHHQENLSDQSLHHQNVNNQTLNISTQESISYSPCCSSELKNIQKLNSKSHKNIFESSQNSDIFTINDVSPRRISPISTSKTITSKTPTSMSTSTKNSSTNNAPMISPDIFSTPSTLPPKRKRPSFKPPFKKKGLLTFKPPKPLSRQEILKSQREILQKYLESSNNEEEAEKNMKRLMNMPSVDQLRNQEYLVKIQRSEDGTAVIIPAASPKRRLKKHIPLKRKMSSNGDFDKTLLSDKNSQKFTDFLGSKKDDGFMFNFGSQNQTESFNPFETRNKEKRRGSNVDNNSPFLNFISQTVEGEGYYKDNKGGIKDLCSKYL